MNKQRERLVELLQCVSCNAESCSAVDCGRCGDLDKLDRCQIEAIADHLLANGIIVPPCKVGDVVYVISRYYAGDWEVYKCEIDAITIYENNTFISCIANDVRFGKINFGLNISEIGKTVFLSREEAEQALVTDKNVGGKKEEGVQGEI